eukprot:10009847-Alexandrium_andersonii.AAC.1
MGHARPLRKPTQYASILSSPFPASDLSLGASSEAPPQRPVHSRHCVPRSAMAALDTRRVYKTEMEQAYDLVDLSLIHI